MHGKTWYIENQLGFLSALKCAKYNPEVGRFAYEVRGVYYTLKNKVIKDEMKGSVGSNKLSSYFSLLSSHNLCQNNSVRYFVY